MAPSFWDCKGRYYFLFSKLFYNFFHIFVERMEPQIPHTRRYASVILPVKFSGEVSYIVPNIFEVERGSRVKVELANRIYPGVVKEILSSEEVPTHTPDGKEIQYKPLLSVEPLPKILPTEIELWEQVAQYYLCSVGEVFKAAYPALTVKQESVKPRKTVEMFLSAIENEQVVQNYDVILSISQQKALHQIKENLHKPVLLRGVTGSGKTEIYITLALEQLRRGKSVLYMVPEIAISKQLQSRLKRVFGERLLTFHSKQTAAEKARIHRILQYNAASLQIDLHGEAPHTPNSAVVILGTRSSLFLPLSNLGLVIVDEEHDSSYKQTEPAPRYQAKDTAIMLSRIHKAGILLGSATPSFESEYNCLLGRFALVELTEKYYGATPPQVEIVDTIYARKTRQMVGNFSQKLINEMRRTMEQGNQVLVFRNRRSYSPIVECQECGEIPKCPHCNVHLSYHKYNNTLRCHYCDFTGSFTGVCRSCGTSSFIYKGAGTEKLEEELANIFPNATIARYDADIAQSKKAEEQVIKDFAEGKINILVGTQMISKGFDFEKLSLVAVIGADTILGIQDFRADEKALQLMNQLMGRTGRRLQQGKLIIQTSQKEHPVLQSLLNVNTSNSFNPDNSSLPSITAQLLGERQQFQFAPYVRMVKIMVKHKDAAKLQELCSQILEKLQGSKDLEYRELTGPFTPVIDKIRGEFIKCFFLKFARNSHLARNKQILQECIGEIKGYNSIIVDVDPLY
ncbi:MAG: primosomal protein N' [Bacteroidales bacterium]|nr:primosomal protein N' [Bacteroidales bacterium]